MKIGIVYSPDPVYMNPFIESLIKDNKEKISCVIMTKGSILSKKSLLLKINYFFTLFLVLGIKKFIQNLFLVTKNNFKKDSRIEKLCFKNSIPFFEVETINSKEAKSLLRAQNLDLVFNQSQHIVKKDVLSIPKFGMFNRHGALLPYYRGRLAPFWQLLNGEEFGGITYHKLNEKIDDGQIVRQAKIRIESNETFNTLVAKMFNKAVELWPNVVDDIIENKIQVKKVEDKGSYFGSPKFKDAIKFRFQKRNKN